MPAPAIRRYEMSQIIVEDPDLYEEKEVDSSGRIYLGKDWANRRVKVVVETVPEEAGTGNPNPAAPMAD